MIANWKTIHTSILLLAFLAMVSTLIKGIIKPSASQSIISEVKLPETIKLDSWKQVETVSLETNHQGKKYEYQKNNQSLVINAYFIPSSEGNVSRFLQTYQDIPPATVQLETIYREEIGFYGFFVYDQNPNLVACINPYGETTVTSQQFAQNISQNGIQIKRILPWLLGQQDLINRSCLLTIITLDNDNNINARSVTVSDRAKLENAWFSWYEVMQKEVL